MIDYYEQLKALVDEYNLTARDVAFHLAKSEDTAKAYLASPNTTRHRKISEACLKQLETSVKCDLDTISLLHEKFNKIIKEFETQTAKTFGYTKEEMQGLFTQQPRTELNSAKAFYKLIDSLENMYVEFCCHVNAPSYIRHVTSNDYNIERSHLRLSQAND